MSLSFCGQPISAAADKINRLSAVIIRRRGHFLVSTGFTVIDVDEAKADADYIFYYLTQRDIVEHLQAIGEQSTSAYPSIKASDIEDLILFLPPLEEQKKIVEILNAITNRISNNTAINNNLLQQVRSICKSFVINRKDIELSPLSESCIIVTKGTTPTTLGKPFTEQGINFIKAESILDDHSIDRSKFAFIDEETNQLLRRSIIQHGDIVYTIAGTLGRFALIDESVLPANTNQAVAIIRVNQEKIAPEYIYSLFIADWQNEYYSKRIQQAVQANLSLTTIKTLPIPILTGEDMKNYVSLVSPMIATMKENEKENIVLSASRDALLPMLMSGEIDLTGVEI